MLIKHLFLSPTNISSFWVDIDLIDTNKKEKKKELFETNYCWFMLFEWLASLFVDYA